MVKLFHKLFPDVAERELRGVEVRDDGEAGGVPAGEYMFVESYCTNPYCNCQRVIISVVERRLGIVASISYDLNPSGVPTYAGQPNPCLEPGIDQSKYAEASLALFKELVREEEYNERLRRHYRLVKSAASSSSGRPEGGTVNRRGEWAKQQRRQQKAARRKNRRR